MQRDFRALIPRRDSCEVVTSQSFRSVSQRHVVVVVVKKERSLVITSKTIVKMDVAVDGKRRLREVFAVEAVK